MRTSLHKKGYKYLYQMTALLTRLHDDLKRRGPVCCSRLPLKAQGTAADGHDIVGLSVPREISLSDTPIIPADPTKQTARSRAPSEAASSPNATLYDKLGGPEALEAAVDLFYEKVLDDDRLKHFFEGTNMMRLVIKQVHLLISNTACQLKAS